MKYFLICTTVLVLFLFFRMAFAGPTDPPGQSRTDWFCAAKYGIEVNWMPGATEFPLVNQFDVNSLANQLEEAGAGYLIWPLGQNSGYYSSPNATYNSITGYSAGQRTSLRDLPMDLYNALQPKGIKLLFYLPAQVANQDPKAQAAFGLAVGPDDQYITIEAANLWASVIQEWSDRYGSKVAGWWFDGCWSSPPGFDETRARIYANAVYHGNPNAMVTFNRGWSNTVPIVSFSSCEDYTGGEADYFGNYGPLGMSVPGRWIGTSQSHIWAFFEPYPPTYPDTTVRFDNQTWINWMKSIISKEGVVTLQVNAGSLGQISDLKMGQLRAIRAAIRTSIIDTSAPSAPASVRDGTSAGTDASSTYSTTQLSANWTAATDAESGISAYKYAIGTTAGATNITNGWISNGTNLTVTKTGLTLTIGTTYYFSVKAVNGASPALESVASNSNGQVVLAKAKELAGHWKLDEASGSSAVDSSGKGNTGTLNGSPAWAPAGGKSGGALGFDGTDDYVNYGANGILNFSAGDEFTIAVWVKTSESYGPVITQRSSTESGAIIEVAVGYDGAVASAGRLMVLVREDAGGSGYARITGGAVNNGEWRHFALKRNTNGSIELFLDGVSQGTNTGAQSGGAITTDLRAMGSERRWVQDSYGTADQRYLNGSIDDARIYNYALTTAEIQALASAGADTTPPGAPGTVRDGAAAGVDISSTTSRAQLSANWTAAADTESGVSGYSYAIGTTAGNTNVTNGWLSNGTNLTVTKTGLNLSVGTTYYFSVKAVNGAGLTGAATNSNGQIVLSTATADTTPPGAPASVKDGATAGTDAGFTYSTTQLSANWTAAIDNESGITNYQFSIGTTPGGTQTSGWAAIGNVFSITKTGLTLTAGTTYYFSVKAVNGAGLTGAAANSNGQYVAVINTADTTPPSAVAQVRDGADAGADADVTNLTDELSANWSAAADAESGVAKYYYAIGTRPAGTDVASWTDNGQLTEVTHTGLSLAIGATYYFSVKAENGVGMQSAVTNSDGQLVQSMDTQGPLISNVTAQGITHEAVTVTWETDEPSTSRVEYGLTAGYGSLTGEYLGMNTAHSVTISGLQSQTQYHFRVISRDYAGNESTSVDYTFTTLSTLNTQPSSPAYPNPYDLSRPGGMKFKVNATSAETPYVSIYTISGKLVRKLPAQLGATEISWDGTNEDGEKVIRGVYIYTLTNGSGSKITGKLAVVR